MSLHTAAVELVTRQDQNKLLDETGRLTLTDRRALNELAEQVRREKQAVTR